MHIKAFKSIKTSNYWVPTISTPLLGLVRDEVLSKRVIAFKLLISTGE